MMPGRRPHRSREIYRRRRIVAAVAALAMTAGVVTVVQTVSDEESAGPTVGDDTATTVPTEAPIDTSVFSDPGRVGRPYSQQVDGLLTFRGNPTRTYYGQGPVPAKPGIEWYYPKAGGMCSESSTKGETKTWCGGGWTGEPAVFERDGRTWVVFGAYDRAVHFVDAATGEDLLPPFPTGDIIKGSVTVDPDGFPLVYTGSRDGYYRVLAIDRPGSAVELWKLSAKAVSPTLWNDDWDGSGIVSGDYLFEGGENSQFHVVKLNRGRGADGLVTVDPSIAFHAPGWDDQQIKDLAGNRSKEMSIENSVAVWKDVVYFANSGGLVQGWDVSPLRSGGTPTRVFRYWTGDDTDASVVIDADGMLYVGVEYERANTRAKQVGQLIKLDPTKPDPLVWKFDDQGRVPAGVWSTPAIDRDVVYTTTNGGRLVALDRMTGAVRWAKSLPPPVWQSPVVVDHVLIEGDCIGVLHAYDVADTTKEPTELWSVSLGACIEATPALWKGALYFATRGGRFFKLSDAGTLPSPTADRSGTGSGTGSDDG